MNRILYLEELSVLVQLSVQIAVLLVVLLPLGPSLLVLGRREARNCNRWIRSTNGDGENTERSSLA
jgi:hypothetical protein